MSRATSMWLRVLTPTRVVLELEVVKVIAEGEDGSFALLPRHVDVVSALVPGLLVFTEVGEGPAQEHVLAVNSGTLVKCGRHVDVATSEAIRGEDPQMLAEQLRRAFVDVDEREQRSRAALARLESDLTAQLIELEHG